MYVFLYNTIKWPTSLSTARVSSAMNWFSHVFVKNFSIDQCGEKLDVLVAPVSVGGQLCNGGHE